MKNDGQIFSLTEIDDLKYVIVINADGREYYLIEETINFLIKTGMPKIVLRSVLIREKSGDLDHYLDSVDCKQKRNNTTNLYACLETVYGQPKSLYFLFLTAGAKISWGSFDCLHRAAVAQPDAAVISAVFRRRNGRIVIPRRSYNPWSYVKNFMLPRNSDVVNVNGFFKEAVLIKGGAAVEIMHGKVDLDGKDLDFLKYHGYSVCVLAAQLISLRTIFRSNKI